MKTAFVQDFNTSFYLWAAHQIAAKADTVQFQSGAPLYKMEDSGYEGYYAYGSRHKPWCADLSLIPNTPTGVYTSSGFATGVFYDYQNGRILSSVDFGPQISGDYYSQEVGIYLSSSDEEKILFENEYQLNPRFYQATGAVPADKFMVPCVFLSLDHYENEPFAFGGEDETVIRAKAVVVCEYDIHRDTIMSVFTDLARTSIPFVSYNNSPFNEFFNVVSGYNYNDYVNLENTTEDFFVDKVVTSRLSRSLQSKLPQSISVAFADLTISKVRYPRA